MMQFKSLGVAALLAAAFVSGAQSQQYPVKPVRAISPFAPGGVTDKVLRPLTLELGKRFEQPVVLEVRPGADTIIGAEIAKIAGTPQFLNQFIHSQGLEPILKTPEDFARQLNEDRKTAERLIQQTGLQPQ